MMHQDSLKPAAIRFMLKHLQESARLSGYFLPVCSVMSQYNGTKFTMEVKSLHRCYILNLRKNFLEMLVSLFTLQNCCNLQTHTLIYQRFEHTYYA